MNKILFGAIACAFLTISIQTQAQGFREHRSWQFEDPITKAARMQREQIRLLREGGFYEGRHANKSIYIGDVHIDEVSGNMQLTDQSNTNVGTISTISQEGSGTLNVDTVQESGPQLGLNVSRQQGAGDTGGDFNGTTGSSGSPTLNVGGGL